MRSLLSLVLVLACLVARGADHVVAVSIDGMGSGYLQALIDAGKAPHFQRLQAEGAGTTNARADYAITVTLPNHVTMLTGRPILGPAGHNWTGNTDPAKGMTLHSNKTEYVASAFDVAHDNERRTGLWAAKTKFSLFSVSYDTDHGQPDGVGADNGRDKLDVYDYRKSADETTREFLQVMTNQPCHFAFVHFGEGDAIGHFSGWGSDAFNAAVTNMDACLGQIMTAIETSPALRGRTALIVTADHGGKDKNHYDAADPTSYTIPFYVWGAGVTPGDLYALNPKTRQFPGTGRPDYTADPQPIRNGDVGNLALDLLGLGPIPGSIINQRQDLKAGGAK